MPRLMSFFLTWPQHQAKAKTVTRRNGWGFLKPGDVVQGAEKCQGLKKGQQVNRGHLIEIVSIRSEVLNWLIKYPEYGKAEMILEGFPDMSPEKFVSMYCAANRCQPDDCVNRIEFKYIKGKI